MNKKAKIATIATMVSIIALVVLMAVFVLAAPKKCSNGADDDNDGLVDYPADPGCSSSSDNTETGTAVCDDGADATNDADSLADFRLSGGDPGCTSATDSNERDGACDDLSDNEGDGTKDFTTSVNFTADPECASYADVEQDCSDTDGGPVYTVQGTTSGSWAGTPFNSTDSCPDSVTLTEYYCGGILSAKLSNQTKNCVNATAGTTQCSFGACI